MGTKILACEKKILFHFFFFFYTGIMVSACKLHIFTCDNMCDWPKTNPSMNHMQLAIFCWIKFTYDTRENKNKKTLHVD